MSAPTERKTWVIVAIMLGAFVVAVALTIGLDFLARALL